MGNWLQNLEKKKSAEDQEVNQRLDEWKCQRDKEWKDQETTYHRNVSQIESILERIKEIEARIESVKGRNILTPTNSGYSIRIGAFPSSYRSGRGSSGVTPGDSRRIELVPCSGNLFRIEIHDDKAWFVNQKKYVKISNVSDDMIMSWLRWIHTGKGIIRLTDKLRLAVLAVVAILILYSIIRY